MLAPCLRSSISDLANLASITPQSRLASSPSSVTQPAFVTKLFEQPICAQLTLLIPTSALIN
jgi:hypothetical protein